MRSTRSRSTCPRSAPTRSTCTPSSGRGCATLILMDLRLDHGSWATPWQLICVAITSSSRTPMMEKIISLLFLGECSFITTASSAGCVPRAMVPKLSVTTVAADLAGDLSCAAKPPVPRSALSGLPLSRACTLADLNRNLIRCCCSYMRRQA